MCNMHGNRTKAKYTKALCYMLIDLGDKMIDTSRNMNNLTGWEGTSHDISNILSGRKPIDYKNFIFHFKEYLILSNIWEKYKRRKIFTSYAI